MTEADDPTLAIARDLRSIVDLADLLHDQAANRAAHKDIPGGDATVFLGPVASPEAWENRVETIERLWWEDDERGHKDRPNPEADEITGWEPPLQTLLFWSEAWRWEHDTMLTGRPTVGSEAAWLGSLVGWAYDHEVHFDDFAADMANARRRLEALLYAGERGEHGIAKCDCGGDLDRAVMTDDDGNQVRRDCHCRFRPLAHANHGNDDLCCVQCWWDARHARHDQGGLRDEWVCGQCHARYDSDGYKRLVARDARDNATALPSVMMVERFDGVTVGMIRVWALRGFVKRHGRDELGRMLYDVADVEARAPGVVLAG